MFDINFQVSWTGIVVVREGVWRGVCVCLQTSRRGSDRSQGSLTVMFRAIQVRSPASCLSLWLQWDVIASFVHPDQDLVLTSTFAIHMQVMCIVMQECLKLKHICACSLKCEVLYYSVFVLKEWTGDCLSVATKCFIYFFQMYTLLLNLCSRMPWGSGSIISPDILH